MEDKNKLPIILNKIILILGILSLLITLVLVIWFIIERNKAFSVKVDILNTKPLKDIVDKRLYELNKILEYIRTSLLVSGLLLGSSIAFSKKKKSGI